MGLKEAGAHCGVGGAGLPACVDEHAVCRLKAGAHCGAGGAGLPACVDDVIVWRAL